ncbi:deoxyuridine 5 -triphosphate nucleotidohydrolase-like [Pelobates cultripes]|uniref:Deoxyuridine 5'-triphosphate nucleotidohydrolase n=1 Tax=Pelobates cultripes TaxID=61616 RepID=A0AAD1VTP6_PELCU|nr:deoxyuridine 5 -triphosphate nucleotidohydrolase-like [Pelobates cultripes]
MHKWRDNLPTAVNILNNRPLSDHDNALTRMIAPNIQAKPYITSNTITYWEIEEGALAPYRATPEAAGIDLRARKEERLKIGQVQMFPTGIGIQIPQGHFGLIAPRSSLALKGIHVMGRVIDADYQGEIKILLLNQGPQDLLVQEGDRIAQLVIIHIYQGQINKGTAPTLQTVRGDKGFGSTNLNPGAKVWVRTEKGPPEPADIIATGNDNTAKLIGLAVIVMTALTLRPLVGSDTSNEIGGWDQSDSAEMKWKEIEIQVT